MDMNMNMNNYMQGSFYWGKNVIILFAEWPGDNPNKYILALIVVFFAAAITELLSIPNLGRGRRLTSVSYHTFVYSIRMGLLYLVMLSVMSFNAGVFISAIAGHAVGFYSVKRSALKRAQLDHDDEEQAPNSVH